MNDLSIIFDTCLVYEKTKNWNKLLVLSNQQSLKLKDTHFLKIAVMYNKEKHLSFPKLFWQDNKQVLCVIVTCVCTHTHTHTDWGFAGLGECDYLCLRSPGLQVYCRGRYHRQPSHCSNESSAADRTGEQISHWKLKPHKSAFISYITMRLVKMILVSATVSQSREPLISRIYSFLIQITLNRAVYGALAYVKLSSISAGWHFWFSNSND